MHFGRQLNTPHAAGGLVSGGGSDLVGHIVCIPSAARSWTLRIAAAALILSPANGRAQNTDFDPAALGKQRTALYLKATSSPLGDLEGEVNHLAVLSETCRAQYGAKACGLGEKTLGSDKLEERYAYYVSRPTEAHLSGQGVKVDSRNWKGSDEPANAASTK
jgi:hypothetical protein